MQANELLTAAKTIVHSTVPEKGQNQVTPGAVAGVRVRNGRLQELVQCAAQAQALMRQPTGNFCNTKVHTPWSTAGLPLCL